ncbi:MAG: alcohol dehydrogenase catalytic domain-containing protein [Acidobacteria bacterium]|nr:alcohol dehydrogenase catalytic domain-containing protein [Acidobacteriota bacterium]
MNAVHIAAGRLSLIRRPTPRRQPGHSLLRLVCGGICNTDIELLRGYYGFSGTPGHEFVAEVLESDDPRLPGRRVTGEINLPCRRCGWCLRGLGRHCPHRTVLGIVKHPGAFSDFFTLPDENLHVIPNTIPTQHAVFAEPVAAACEILDQVRIPKAAPVAVLGDGKLGLLIAQVLQAHGAQVTLYGRHKSKLKIARAAGVATEISNKLPRAAYDYSVEATGSSDGLTAAVQITRPRGTIILKSTVHDRVPLDTAPVIVNEITLIGSRCGRFEPALKLLKSGRLQLDQMISDQFALTDAPRAFARAQEPGVLKVLLWRQIL